MQTTQRPSRMNSIFLKLTLVTVLLTTLVTGILTVLNWLSTEDMIAKLVRDRAASETQALSSEAAGKIRFDHRDKMEGLFLDLAEHAEGTAVDAIALDLDGEVVARMNANAPADDQLLDLARQALRSGQQVLSDDGFVAAVPALFGESQEQVGAIATRWSSAPLIKDIRKEEVIAFSITVGVFLIAVLGSLFLLDRTIAQPLRQIQNVIRAFGNRDYSAEVPLQSPPGRTWFDCRIFGRTAGNPAAGAVCGT